MFSKKKKKMLIIGNSTNFISYNKEYFDEYLNYIENNFDIIVRYNNADSLIYTGTKCDYLFFVPNAVFRYYYKDKPYNQNIIKNVKQLFVMETWHLNQWNYEENNCGIPLDLFNNKIVFNFKLITNNPESHRVRTVCHVINYCVNNFLDEYDIYITGIDINNRKFDMLVKNECNYHYNVENIEKQYLNDLLDKHKINKIEKNIFNELPNIY